MISVLEAAALATSAILGDEQIATPTTGQTVTCTAGKNKLTLLIVPVGTLPTLIATLPSTSLINGQIVIIHSTQLITALTLNGGTIVGIALTTLALGGFASYRYSSTTTNWHRIG